jgi:hypothetical protein
MGSLPFDMAHLLAGGLVLVSFLLLYQDRLYALLNIYALHATVLAASVAWQAYIQDAPHLYVTAAIALGFKAITIPVVLHRVIERLGDIGGTEHAGGECDKAVQRQEDDVEIVDLQIIVRRRAAADETATASPPMSGTRRGH